jgi:uncharacterized membrane protein
VLAWAGGVVTLLGIFFFFFFFVLAVSLAKIFLYDLTFLSSVARALSFLAVGAVLLLGGFLSRSSAPSAETPRPRP